MLCYVKYVLLCNILHMAVYHVWLLEIVRTKPDVKIGHDTITFYTWIFGGSIIR